MEPCTPDVCQQATERPVLGKRQSAAGLDLVDDQHSIPSEKKYQPVRAPSLDIQVRNLPLNTPVPFETGDSSKSTPRQSLLGCRLSPTAAIDAARHQHSIEPSHMSPPRSAFPDPIINAKLPATTESEDGNVASRSTEDGHVLESCPPAPCLRAQGNGGNLRLPAKAPDPRVSLPCLLRPTAANYDVISHKV